MAEQEPRWLALDVRPGDPITGRIKHLDGDVRDFSGWLGLALELERALGSAQSSSTPSEGNTP